MINAGNRSNQCAQELGDIKNQMIGTGKRIPRLGKQGQEGNEDSHFLVAEPAFDIGSDDVDRRNQISLPKASQAPAVPQMPTKAIYPVMTGALMI